MTRTNPRDRATVRRLLAEHVPSGFPAELEPLTVGDVACQLAADRAANKLEMLKSDLPVNERLLRDRTPLPAELSGRALLAFREEHGIVGGSRLYWLDFQQAAILMLMQRAAGQGVLVIACERTD